MLLDGKNFQITLLEEKKQRTVNWLTNILNKKKVQLKELEKLTGLLNFLNQAIVPGRAFTRCIYAKFTLLNKTIKLHHHVKIDSELRKDCSTWLEFLSSSDLKTISRPFMDLTKPCELAINLKFTSDATANENLGFGSIFDEQWLYGQWEPNFIKDKKPSIEFLELIRKLTLRCLYFNIRVFARHKKEIDNYLSDFLSRLKLDKFRAATIKDKCQINESPEPLHEDLWPLSKLWESKCAHL